MTIIELCEKLREDTTWLIVNGIERETIEHIQYAIAMLKDPDRIKVTRCKDCKHATLTTDGRFCKYCELVTDDDGCEKRVNYDANWYCGSAERVSE